MARQRNVKNAEISATDKGARFNLRVYVYPDGHGNLDGKGYFAAASLMVRAAQGCIGAGIRKGIQ